jgi:glycerol-3-phosphate dehydrogenase
MNRDEMIGRLNSESFDIVIIGGGATGLGVAVDAASRGYRTALLESHDFAKATSSRSTKLVHGGVRYLEQMNFSLVTEALRERGIMAQNAPHLVSNLAFVVPRYKWWEGPFYGIGMKLYDVLAGKLNIEPSKNLNRQETIAAIPNVEQEHLLGGIMYHDGQFDDARMAITLARTAATEGAAIANYCPVTGLVKDNGRVIGVQTEDRETGKAFTIESKVVINATGIFSDTIRKLDDPSARELIEPAQGVHLILDASFQPGANAIMVPHTDDGRVLFVIPWHDRVIVGTTDTPMQNAQLEPRALQEEISFILRNAGRYMHREPSEADILSVFAGQRPLVHPEGKASDSKSISRSHEVFVSQSGLVTIAGGKWTTYRKMAEDTMTHAIEIAGLHPTNCRTEQLHLHGYLKRESADFPEEDYLRCYGTDAAAIERLAIENPKRASLLHEKLPYQEAEVVWATKYEMARTVEDVLARRTRSLLLDARASNEAALKTAEIMAEQLGYDRVWVDNQIASYKMLSNGYFPGR